MKQIDFSHFHYLVMDSSIVIAPLEEELCAELGNYCDPGKMPFVCTSSTFHSEIRQYMQLLQPWPRQQAVCAENLQKLKDHHVRLYIHKYRDYNNRDNTPRHDTWSLLNHLFQINSRTQAPRILLLTGNELLLRRVVLSDLPVSVYDYRTRELLSAEDLASRKKNYELDLQEKEVELQILWDNPEKNLEEVLDSGERLTLYDAPSGGNEVKLFCDQQSDIVRYSGTEGYFLCVEGKPDRVAKIYGLKPGSSFTEQHADVIRTMKTFHDHGVFPWAVLPETLLYDSAGNLAGYVMEKLDPRCMTLEQCSWFNANGDWSLFGEKAYSETLRNCLAILRQISYMSHYDILPVDFGRGNYCLDPDRPFAHFLDTCSVCFKQFLFRRCDPELDPQYASLPEEQNSGFSKLQLIDLYMELVHLFMMSLMTLGSVMEPQEGTGVENFLVEGTQERKLYDALVPENLRQLYWSLFSDPKEPISPFSIEVLMEEMASALEVVEAENPTYASLYQNGGHRGDEYPAHPEDVLPSVYGGDVPVKVVAEVKVEEASFERPKYLRAKNPPPIHTPAEPPRHLPQPSRICRANLEPIPPLPVPERKSRKGLYIGLAILLILGALFCVDMLRFADSDLGFQFAEYWKVRMEMLKESWNTVVETVSDWFAKAGSAISGLFS